MPQSSHNQSSDWRTALVTIEGSYGTPDGVAISIKVKVKDAKVGRDICVENIPQLNNLAVESTLSGEGDASS